MYHQILFINRLNCAVEFTHDWVLLLAGRCIDFHVCGPGLHLTPDGPVAPCCTSKRTTTEQSRGGSPQSLRTNTGGGQLWAAEMDHIPPSRSHVAPAACHVSVRSPSALPRPAVSRESQDQENSHTLKRGFSGSISNFDKNHSTAKEISQPQTLNDGCEVKGKDLLTLRHDAVHGNREEEDGVAVVRPGAEAEVLLHGLHDWEELLCESGHIVEQHLRVKSTQRQWNKGEHVLQIFFQVGKPQSP